MWHALQLRAQRESALVEAVLDVLQRRLAEVRDRQQVRRRAVDELGDGVDPAALEAVPRALGEADGLVTTEGTLYPLLGRLRREGVVDTTWRESPSGPPRRYYRLTPDGQAALGGFVIEWTRFRDSVDALLGNGVLR